MKCTDPLNILVIEAYTDANIGSGALVENSVNILRQRYPSSAIRVMAHCPKAFADLCGVDAVDDVFAYPFGRSRLRQVLWLAGTALWMIVVYLQALLLGQRAWLCRSKVRDILWADLVVSVGAERINDKFIKNVVFSLFTYSLVKRLGRKMVLFPCTVGPFLHGWTRWLTARVLADVDLVYTRDALSTQTTRQLPGVGDDKVVDSSDVAVLQQRLPRAAALEKLGIDPARPIVGISVMRWTYVANKAVTPYSTYEAYVEQMAIFADALVARGLTVIFYPTNYPVHQCREDDVNPAREILGQMSHRQHVRIVDELPTPSEFKGMLACSEINITTRMHACILSTGAGVPTMSVNYLFKLREYMESLGLGDFSIDIEDFNAAWAIDAFDRMWNDRARWREVVETAIAAKQRHLSASMERLDAILA